MKLLKFILFYLSICFGMVSCIENDFNAKDRLVSQKGKDGYIWYKFKYDGKYGIADEKGNILTLPKYDEIIYNSDGGFYELRAIADNREDTIIAIETKEHEKKVLLQQGVSKYGKDTLDDGRRFYYYTIRYEDEEKRFGAYDKQWNLIVPPIMEGSIVYREKETKQNGYSCSPKYEGEGVERFGVWMKIGDDYNILPFSICLNSDGEVAYVKEKMIYMNLYETISYRLDYETMESSTQHTGVHKCFMIYRDHILDFGAADKYAYMGMEDGDKKYFLRTITDRDHETYYYKLFVDKNYNISGSYYNYEQQLDFDGTPLIWSFYDDLKEQCDAYKKELSGMMRDEIDHDAILWSKLKKAVNNHFWNKKCNEDDAVQAYKKAHEPEIEQFEKKLASTLEYYNIKTQRGHTKMELPSSEGHSSTSDNDKAEDTQTIIVEHHRDPVPVQEWVDCMTCRGSGICQVCGGNGWLPSARTGTKSCYNCREGKCPTCGGNRGHYQTIFR